MRVAGYAPKPSPRLSPYSLALISPLQFLPKEGGHPCPPAKGPLPVTPARGHLS